MLMDNKRGLEVGAGGMGEVIDAQPDNRVGEGYLRGDTTGESQAGMKETERRDSPVEVEYPTQDNNNTMQQRESMSTETEVPPVAEEDTVNLTTKDGESLEPEWVHEVENTVNETRNNPLERQKKIARLRKTFVGQRFRRQIEGNE